MRMPRTSCTEPPVTGISCRSTCRCAGVCVATHHEDFPRIHLCSSCPPGLATPSFLEAPRFSLFFSLQGDVQAQMLPRVESQLTYRMFMCRSSWQLRVWRRGSDELDVPVDVFRSWKDIFAGFRDHGPVDHSRAVVPGKESKQVVSFQVLHVPLLFWDLLRRLVRAFWTVYCTFSGNLLTASSLFWCMTFRSSSARRSALIDSLN